jgi:hypothetical protein
VAPVFSRQVRTLRGAILLVTLLGLVTRAPWLDADPSVFKQAAELTDEGFWAHNARTAVVLGREFPDDLAQAPAAAPLFHWVVTGIFRGLGAGLAPLRIVSVAAAILLLPLAMALVAGAAGLRAAVLLGVLVLANHELFAFARLGMPEMLHLLFATAGALAWLRRRGRWGAAVAGALFAGAMLAKLNVLVMLGFSGVWMLEALQAHGGRRCVRADVIAFAAGAATLLVPWALAYYLPHATLFGLNNVALNRDRLALTPSDLGRLPLHFVNNPFWGLPSTFVLLGLAARYLVRLPPRFTTGWRAGIQSLSPLETLTIGWLLGIALPTAILVRAVGERRVLALLIPLAVLAVLGAFARDPVAPGGRASTAAIGILVATSLITGVALVFGAGHGARVPTGSGLTVLLLAAGALTMLLSWLGAQGWLTTGRAACATAVVAAVAPALSLGAFAAWATSAPAWATALAGLVLMAAMVAADRRAVFAALAVYVVWGAWAIGANVLRPTYSVRDASATLQTLTKPGDVVAGAYAHLLAIETDALPLWYTPRRDFNRLLNADPARFDVRWVLIGEGRTTTQVEDYPFALTRVREIPLMPAPQGGYKTVVTLYRRAD